MLREPFISYIRRTMTQIVSAISLLGLSSDIFGPYGNKDTIEL